MLTRGTADVVLGNTDIALIAHDRRSHGRSGQTWDGNDMDTYADDLAALFELLELQDAVMIGSLHRRRRGCTVSRKPWLEASGQGRAHCAPCLR